MNIFTKNELNTLLATYNNSNKNISMGFIKDFSGTYDYEPYNSHINTERVNNELSIDCIFFTFESKKHKCIESMHIKKENNTFIVYISTEEYLRYNAYGELIGLYQRAENTLDLIKIINVFMELMDL